MSHIPRLATPSLGTGNIVGAIVTLMDDGFDFIPSVQPLDAAELMPCGSVYGITADGVSRNLHICFRPDVGYPKFARGAA